MKDNLIKDIIQEMLPFLNNAQGEKLRDVLQYTFAKYEINGNVTEDKEVILNELNTIPGLTATSRYPSMMKEAGIEFADLIDKLIELAMQRTIGAC